MKAIGILILGGLLLWGASWLLFMDSVIVEPGTEVVLIDRPVLVGHEGVRPETLKDGRTYIWGSTKDYVVPVIPVTYHVNFNDLSTSDGNMLDFETSIQLKITDPIKMVTKFGPDWFKNNVQAQYINIVRDVVKTATMSQILYDAETSKDVDLKIQAALAEKMKTDGIPVTVMSTLLGRGLPNPEVLRQINETAAARQRQMTIAAATVAEEKRKEQEEKRAAADNAYRNAMSLDPQQYVELERIKAIKEACTAAKECILVNGAVQPTIPVK